MKKPAPADRIRAAVKLLRAGQSDAAHRLLPDKNDLARAGVEWTRQFPAEPGGRFLCAELLRLTGDTGGAIAAYQQAVATAPRHLGAQAALGGLLALAGSPQEALVHTAAALQIDDSIAGLHCNHALALDLSGRATEAIAAYRRAISLDPRLVTAHNNLGLLLHGRGAFDEAERCLRECIRLNPSHAVAYANLATVLKDQGFVAEAFAAAQASVAIDPACELGWTNAVLMHPYLGDALQPHSRAAQLRAYDQSRPRSAGAPLARPSNGRRRLRIGYVSADFRDHAVNYFFEPVLEAHDRERFEVFCYDSVATPDPVNSRLRGLGDTWRQAGALDDSALAQLIAQDGIDVLVDLMGHTGGNRLSTFASRPAPIQISWLGWPATTGLSEMDYRVLDRHLIDGHSELQTERMLVLPDTWLCYRPDPRAPQIDSTLQREGSGVCFGSFNGVYKLGDRVLAAWAELLRRLPEARLLIAGVPPGRGEQRLQDAFGARGVRDRVELVPACSLEAFFGHHKRVDIALDPFPFNGSTTTLHSLWMGVPVITLAGTSHAGRMGCSIMRNLDLEYLIAHTEQQYIDAAIRLSDDVQARRQLRMGLREHLIASPLMDCETFTRSLEAAYLRGLEGGKTEPPRFDPACSSESP